MDDKAVYRKSGKGAEAITSRSLTGKLRTLLILVDGKKPVGELRRLGAGLGEADPLLAQLEAEGYMEVVPDAVVATPAPAVAAAVPGGDGRSLAHVKTLASRRLVETLGPLADDVCLKIEAAGNVSQFIDAMKRAYAVVREVRGQSAADRFGEEIEAQMPAA